MAFTNNMNRLLNKIERRIGTKMLNLPEHLQKDKWVDTILEDTLMEFSRYIPNKIIYNLDTSYKNKQGYYLIDENELPPDVEILGIRDLSFETLSGILSNSANLSAFGYLDHYNVTYGIDDLWMTQMAADHSSMYNRGIFVYFEDPNKVKIVNSANQDVLMSSNKIPLELLITHSHNLSTIPPTMMGIFEELAISDVCIFLYNNLKYFDNLETVFGNVNIRLDDIKEKADRRIDILNELKEGYVSMANKNQPAIYSV